MELVFQLRTLPALVVWERLYSSHRQQLDTVGKVELDGRSCDARDVATIINRGGRSHFGIEWDGGTLDYSDVTNSELSLLGICGCVEGQEDAETWLGPFADEVHFRQARLYVTEYDFWQNAQDPLEYRTEGRSYKGLPMKSNNHPPPLEQMVIDTSRNPGRRVLRRGFIEAVGCPMWLGEGFWGLTGTRRENVCDEQWVRCETWCRNVVRIRSSSAPFTTAAGEAGQLQERLRWLLFPKVE